MTETPGIYETKDAATILNESIDALIKTYNGPSEHADRFQHRQNERTANQSPSHTTRHGNTSAPAPDAA